ncbi:MAG: M48 family metalloprotease [Pseudomonadota bacterium]
MHWLLPLVAVLTLLAGCSVNPVSGKQEFVMMSEAEELALGRKEHPNILEQYGDYSDAELQAYVEQVGQRLARNSHRSDIDYTFTLLDSMEVNAFALPGGYIYITRGILAYLNNEAELAAVLGHEIGHVTARHSVRRLSAASAKELGYGLTAMFVPELRNESVKQLFDVLGTALIRGYGREHELEADRLGAQYLARTGYDPEAMLGVIRVLKNQELFERQRAREEQREPRVYHGLFATHPDNDKRLKEVVRAADKLKGATISRVTDREGFLLQQRGLVYGASAEQGILHGSSFYHRDLAIALRFPQGWDVDNRSDRLVAVAPDQAAILQLTMLDSAEGEPESWLRENAPDIAQLRRLDGTTLRGATGLVRIETGQGVRNSRIAIVDHRATRYLFIGVPGSEGALQQHDDAFLQTIRALRPLREDERHLAEPKRIELHRLRSGERLADVARRSTIERYAEEQLRLLNDYYPSGEPAPGSLLKTVR